MKTTFEFLFCFTYSWLLLPYGCSILGTCSGDAERCCLGSEYLANLKYLANINKDRNYIQIAFVKRPLTPGTSWIIIEICELAFSNIESIESNSEATFSR